MKIGIMLPIAETDRGTILRYRDIRDAALQAERDRFDPSGSPIISSSSGMDQRRGIWEGWTLLSALAEATDSHRARRLVMCTAFRNPALLAKMADAVDEVSEGRLTLGLGAGWHEPEFSRLRLSVRSSGQPLRGRCASSRRWLGAASLTTRECMNGLSTALASREARDPTVRRS